MKIFSNQPVDTPLQECEKRDPKHLYAMARAGKLSSFTGLDDPYEIPMNPEIAIDTTNQSTEDSVEQIIHYLVDNGLIKASVL